jgi:hypothetical protein
MTSRSKIKQWLVLSALGGVPLITSATCDPVTGVFDFYRDDDFDDFYYDDYYFDYYYYDDCFFDCF